MKLVAVWGIANAIWGNHDANPYDSGTYQTASPSPSNNQNNTQMASSLSRESRGSPGANFELPSWNGVWEGLKDFGNRLLVSGTGAMNAWSSNQMLGIGRLDADFYGDTEYDFIFKAGQVAGDLASIVTGVEEIIDGLTYVGGGVVAAPFSSGTSLAASAAGGLVAAHGLTTVTNGFTNFNRGISNLFDSFGKQPSPKVLRGSQPKNSGKLQDIPGIGFKGSHKNKLQGLLPSRSQWMSYPKEDLRVLQEHLRTSIKTRTSQLKTRGADRIHGLRLTNER